MDVADGPELMMMAAKTHPGDCNVKKGRFESLQRTEGHFELSSYLHCRIWFDYHVRSLSLTCPEAVKRSSRLALILMGP